MFAEPVVLRGLVAAAAAGAVVGSVVMRQWDRAAGKRVAELNRARAGDEWRHEERMAEVEADLEESRELRTRLEAKLRSKRAELAALRNEHAALLRRYATAETERASALEGRRLLAIEASTPTRALSAGAPSGEGASSDGGAASGAEGASGGGASSVGDAVPGEGASSGEGVSPPDGDAGAGAAKAPAESVASGSESVPAAEPHPPTRPGASPTPSLYGRANVALDRLTRPTAAAVARTAVAGAGTEGAHTGAVPGARDAAAAPTGTGTGADPGTTTGTDESADADDPGDRSGPTDRAVLGAAEAADGHGYGHAHERAVAGHGTVPAAAAVVPPARVRRPAGAGGFDFFGTKGTPAKNVSPGALEAVQNEDLADVVGEEALALHKAEAEAEFRPSDAATEAERGVGQVIDLTAHDETEQIDVEDLRTALRA